MPSNMMDKQGLSDYVTGTAAGRQTHALSEELNAAPGGIEMPELMPTVDPFYIKIWNIRVTPIDEKSGERVETIVWHGQQGRIVIPSATPNMKAVPDEEVLGKYNLEPCAKMEAYSRPYFVPNVQMYAHHNTQTGVTEVLPKDIIKGERLVKSIINPGDGGQDTGPNAVGNLRYLHRRPFRTGT